MAYARRWNDSSKTDRASWVNPFSIFELGFAIAPKAAAAGGRKYCYLRAGGGRGL